MFADWAELDYLVDCIGIWNMTFRVPDTLVSHFDTLDYNMRQAELNSES